MLDSGIGHGNAGGIAQFDSLGNLRHQPRRMVGEFLRETSHVEAAHASDIFAQVLAPAQSGAATTANQCGVGDHAIPNPQIRNVIAYRDHLASRLRTHCQRELPSRKRHAPEAPNVDVVQADAADAKLHLAWPGRWWRIALLQRQFTVGQQLQGAHALSRQSAAMDTRRGAHAAAADHRGAASLMASP
jgi:hypothetical protein